VPFVVFFAACGVGALTAALLGGRFLWRDERRWSALLISVLTGAVAAWCLAVAWVFWDGLF
jgi:hypothetical protein